MRPIDKGLARLRETTMQSFKIGREYISFVSEASAEKASKKYGLKGERHESGVWADLTFELYAINIAQAMDNGDFGNAAFLQGLMIRMHRLFIEHGEAESVLLLRRLIDEFNDEYMEKISCAKGCSTCCYGVPDVSRFEAHALSKLPYNNARLSYTRRNPSVTYPCPFLIGGSCTAYEERPLHCRAHNQTLKRSDYKVVDGRITGNRAIMSLEVCAGMTAWMNAFDCRKLVAWKVFTEK